MTVQQQPVTIQAMRLIERILPRTFCGRAWCFRRHDGGAFCRDHKLELILEADSHIKFNDAMAIIGREYRRFRVNLPKPPRGAFLKAKCSARHCRRPIKILAAEKGSSVYCSRCMGGRCNHCRERLCLVNVGMDKRCLNPKCPPHVRLERVLRMVLIAAVAAILAWCRWGLR